MGKKKADLLEKMKRRSKKWERLIALFVLGVVAFNYPVILLVADGWLIAGIPALYVYLFGVWGLLIVISAWIMECRR